MKKATVVVAPRKGVVEVVEEAVNDPGPREVQVRVARSLLSHGTERGFIMARENMTLPFPLYPGYSAAGFIEAVGSEVVKFKIGERVVCPLSHRSVGNVDQDRIVVPLPDSVSFDDGTFYQLVTVGLQGIRKARVEIGESVVVVGLGLVGQLTVQCARINGALPVIGVDRVAKRLEIARECGADYVFDSSDPSWREELKKVVGANGPNVVVEATGVPEVIAEALEVVGHFGRVILQGSTQGMSTVDFYRNVHCKQATIIGALNPGNPKLESRPGHWTRWDEIGAVMKLLTANRIVTTPLITERIGVKDIVKTYEDILTSKFVAMGTLIEWIP